MTVISACVSVFHAKMKGHKKSELVIKVQTMPLVVMFECETEIDAI